MIYIFSLCLFILKRMTFSGKYLSFASISTSKCQFKMPNMVFGSVERSLSIWSNLSHFISFSRYLFRAISLHFLIFINLIRIIWFRFQKIDTHDARVMIRNHTQDYGWWEIDVGFWEQNIWSIKLHDFFCKRLCWRINGKCNEMDMEDETSCHKSWWLQQEKNIYIWIYMVYIPKLANLCSKYRCYWKLSWQCFHNQWA